MKLQVALTQLVGLTGFVGLLVGFWKISHPVALIVGGSLLVVWAVLKSGVRAS